ncbi:hypothetical protein FW774_12215 [Pedobacter sp. BS3]|uniref:hypothetical protein n=1 Tax=Pedobacter sp. BS3 TaxID=2567937 RepID=UPI0011EC2DCD|nr:hypothetical protein [Pedobacter sp. BS3]TZF83062.1 hypothetical protein FW774_12215 [Pedobacter sp. BS3]
MKYVPQFITSILIFIAASCQPEEKQAGTMPDLYFSLKDYFDKEVTRLNAANPLVTKSVLRNEEAEQKELHIRNWATELELFSQSDINKPAWRGEYRVDSADHQVTYTALNDDLSTRKVIISRNSGKITHISIRNVVKNLLYSSNETLDYYPDSLYSIQKEQDVRVIGEGRYQITGRFH